MFLVENNKLLIESGPITNKVTRVNNYKCATYNKSGNNVIIKVSTNKKFEKLSTKSESYTRIKIVKNTLLKTTETYIQKIFVHLKNNERHYIIREIFIDRNQSKKVSENKSYQFKIDASENINDKLKTMFKLKNSTLQLN